MGTGDWECLGLGYVLFVYSEGVGLAWLRSGLEFWCICTYTDAIILTRETALDIFTHRQQVQLPSATQNTNTTFDA